MSNLPPQLQPRASSPPLKKWKSIHQMLGGGKAANLMLWRSKNVSAGTLSGATLAWLLLEKFDYSVLSIVTFALLILIVALFIWSNVATYLDREPLPLPNFHLSNDVVNTYALACQGAINTTLKATRNVALGRDFILFLKVVVVLLSLSELSEWFHSLTFLYICILFALTIPVLYEKYEDKFDHCAKMALLEGHKWYGKFDKTLLSKVPSMALKAKKIT